MNDNPYKTLGVTYESSMEEIKSAYRKLAHIHHPDHGGDVEMFKKIGGAYDYLKKHHIQAVKVSNASTYSNKPFVYYEYDPETGYWWSSNDEDKDGFVSKRTFTKTTPEEFQEKLKKLRASKIGEEPEPFNYTKKWRRSHGW